MPFRSFLLALAMLASCAEPVEVFDDNVCTREETRSLPYWQRHAVDLLVVLDRSPSMADKAAALAAFARTTDAVLRTIEGGVPDLHLAVITSDLGAPDVAACAAGNAGAFQGGARCGLDGTFLEARGLVAGGVSGNFAGTLDATLSCLFDAPLSTCPVSQPLGAAIRALDGSQPGNEGFRRDYAALMIIVVTDTDDATAGARAPLAEVAALTARLRDFVDDPRKLVVSSIAADSAPRLAGLDLPDRTSHTSVSEDWSDALIMLAELGKVPLIGLCFENKLDLDPETPGLQVNCANRIAGADGETVAPLPWCDSPDVDLSQPCIRLIEGGDNWCGDDGTRFDISLGDERLPNTIYAELRCEVACE